MLIWEEFSFQKEAREAYLHFGVALIYLPKCCLPSVEVRGR